MAKKIKNTKSISITELMSPILFGTNTNFPILDQKVFAFLVAVIVKVLAFVVLKL